MSHENNDLKSIKKMSKESKRNYGIQPELNEYIDTKILPQYEKYDSAHSPKHIWDVINNSFDICQTLDLFNAEGLNPNMVYTIAAYHDLGICEGREFHHISSGRMLMEDQILRQWFNEEQILTMKEAVEDHRASTGTTPRSLYGKVVSEADKTIDPDDIIARTILFGASHYPEMSKEEQKARNIAHLHEKYGDGGYLKLQFEGSPNALRLEELRSIIRDSELLEAEYSKFEIHPLAPFLPSNAKTLFLGSFPPPQSRWCMNFYYPNFINDMWRILGHIFYEDKDHFVLKSQKKFDYDKVVAFCKEKGIAIFDAAYMVKREKGNASDKFLKIMVPTDLRGILAKIPECQSIVSTGGKSAEMIAEILGCDVPEVGGYVDIDLGTMELNDHRHIRFYRMPSSSRAYPLSLEKKAQAYRQLF